MKSKGVSLITLVITIIVMIILAGAIILSLSNTNIITKASDAVTSTNIKSAEEKLNVAYTSWLLDHPTETLTNINALETYGFNKNTDIPNNYKVTITNGKPAVKLAMMTIEYGSADEDEKIKYCLKNNIDINYISNDNDDWEISGDTVTKYHGTKEILIIPNKINGVNITKIGWGFLYGFNYLGDGGQTVNYPESLNKVILQDNIIEIDGFAFQCSGDSILIAESVNKIGSNAFVQFEGEEICFEKESTVGIVLAEDWIWQGDISKVEYGVNMHQKMCEWYGVN